MSSWASDDFIYGLIIGALLLGVVYVMVRQSPASQGTYMNEEVWEVVKDEKGRLVKIIGHRRAERA